MRICTGCEKEFQPNRSDSKYCSGQCGNKVRSQRWRDLGNQGDYRNTPRGKFITHRWNAKKRGIPFLLTFDEWWSLWEPYWTGDHHRKLHMCRTGDRGAYEIGNVRIDTCQNNQLEKVGKLVLST